MKNSKLNIVGIIVFIVAVILLVGYAWAKYRTSIVGNSSGDIAKWSFKVNEKTDEEFSIDLASTRSGFEQEADVNSNYIGPGTSGAFLLELDASKSEVSIEYDICMDVDYSSNENFPQNLIFYSDAEMKNAIYHENNTIKLNGTIAYSDSNKVREVRVYWKWDFETGQTQSDKDENNEKDSYWRGRRIEIPITVVGQQVNQDSIRDQYAVTFDANGGTLKDYGNASTMTKYVTYNTAYGELPVPTREGYVFDGWVGENLFDKNVSTENGIKYETWFSHTGWPVTDDDWMKDTLEPSTTYTISYDVECGEVPTFEAGYKNGGYGLFFGKNDWSDALYIQAREFLQIGDIRHIEKNFKTALDLSDWKMYATSNIYYRADDESIYAVSRIIIRNIKIEKGTVATCSRSINSNDIYENDSDVKLVAKWTAVQ